MGNQNYKIENLKKWQDGILDMAKKILREEGELRPVAFFLTEKMSIDEGLQSSALMLKPDGDVLTNLANASDVKPADTIVLLVDLNIGPEQALEVIKSRMPPEMATFVSNLEAEGHRFGIPSPATSIAKVVMQKLELDTKDVVALAIQLMIKKTDAIAYVKLDETWMVSSKGNEKDILAYQQEHGTLENHPDMIEAITSIMETEGLSRMVSVEFKRNRPKTGRIIGFGDPKEIVETPDTESKYRSSGRFTHLFEKAKDQPKPAASPDSN